MDLKLDQILQELRLAGFCYLENFLPKEDLSSMNVFFEERKSEFLPAKVGSQDQKVRLESVRGDFTLWLEPMNPPRPFVSVLKFLDELKTTINSRLYLGLKEFESHLTFYPPGTFYKKHLDRFATDSSRRISFIFYLNQHWDESRGGELVMYDKEGKALKKFFPMPGSFICFLSDEFPHEVMPALVERRSLTGWMHNKIIN